MALLCALGLHSWESCKCTGCGKTRDEGHDWSKDCDKCSRCGNTRLTRHDWSKDCDKCSRCGNTRPSSHDWSDNCDKCSRCGRARSGQHSWIGFYCCKCGTSPLRNRDADTVQALLVRGANPNARERYGDPILFTAVRAGDLGVVRALLKGGADVNAEDTDGLTALMRAALGNKLDVILALLENGADVNAKNKHGTTALIYAATSDNLDAMLTLLENGAGTGGKEEDGRWPLMVAAIEINERRKAALASLQNEIPAETKEKGGETSPIHAIGRGQTQAMQIALTKAASSDNLNVMLTLLENGADVNGGDKDGRTPLMIATFNNRPKTVQALLDRGADVNVKDKDGRDALSWGRTSGPAVAKALRDAGANRGAEPRRWADEMLICQNKECREHFDLGHIVTISDDDIMKSLAGGGATIVGQLKGHPLLVGHSTHPTSSGDLGTLHDSAPRAGWECCRCHLRNSWVQSYHRWSTENVAGLVLRNANFRYYTGGEKAVWGAGYSRVFDPSRFDPRLPTSSLVYLLDGELYDIPSAVTPAACQKILIDRKGESARSLSSTGGRVTEPQAAVLSLLKLKLSIAVQTSDDWDTAERAVDLIMRS